MDKEQAINSFWNGFGVPAYDENTVPANAGYPRITYNVQVDGFDKPVSMYASLWDKSTSWREITLKSKEIEETISRHGGVVIPLDEGYLYITPGTPFKQRLSDPDATLRRIYFNVNAEFLTAF